ncbi:related to conserved hypothetical Ustilaginaceae-specific protein [Ustilago trichophora]|uniref:Related to conserved hypothetical Ustilaginaceae-specific protein n=1 Tax=Ustilago trichophora TaxID=86804 RepID=A0A5C3EA03_9BASI|nr:related to conserved hypothetical Ustilaginaceae-specific protein [Ustilago trichophora]
MSRSTIVLCLVFLAILLLGQSVAMPPPQRVRSRPPPLDFPSSSASVSRESGYETFYRSLLAPLGLYKSEPDHTAPIGSPRGNVRIPAGQTEMYLGLLSDHPAYISPTAANDLNGILRRIRDMVNSPNAPTLAEQRSLVSLLEQEVNRSKRDLFSPLHPENLTSQHKSPIEKLRNKYKALMQLLEDPERLNRLTNQLEPEFQDRFLAANEVLSAEKMLLDNALEMGYVGDFPRLP